MSQLPELNVNYLQKTLKKIDPDSTKSLGYSAAHGFLSASILGYHLREGEELIQLIIGPLDSRIPAGELEPLVEQLVALYEDIQDDVYENELHLPEECTLDLNNIETNFTKESELYKWCTGWILGYKFNKEAWDKIERKMDPGAKQKLKIHTRACGIFAQQDAMEIMFAGLTTEEARVDRATELFEHLDESLFALCDRYNNEENGDDLSVEIPDETMELFGVTPQKDRHNAGTTQSNAKSKKKKKTSKTKRRSGK